jgi:tetratricopeptide (TPR) repeat protein
MEYQLKTISKSGIEEALAKAQLYRFLNEPEESESICQDILVADPENQAALRLLGLAITDQFRGGISDRHTQAESAFRALTDPYKREYYLGILSERRAKAQAHVGRPSHVWVPLFEDAMKHFESAEAIKPANNEEAILRWNRCVRLLQTIPTAARDESTELADDDTAPLRLGRAAVKSAR